MANFWSNKFNKNNKSTYDISKETNVPEEKIKEIINGEREVPTQYVDKMYNSFTTKKHGITSFERAVMEQYFQDNDYMKLRDKFGYRTLEELSKAIGIGLSTIYYLRGQKIKALSDNILKKIYDFFQDDMNIKVSKNKTNNKYNSNYKKAYPIYIDKKSLSKEVLEWYENNNIKKLVDNTGLSGTELNSILGFRKTYYATFCKFVNKHFEHLKTSNWVMVLQLYNYFHNIPLLELYREENKPVFKKIKNGKEIIYGLPNVEIKQEEPEFLDVEPSKSEENIPVSRMIDDGKVSKDNKGVAVYIEVEEYQKVVDELNRYKYLIDQLIKKEKGKNEI